jgi:hypothetical protein
MTQIYTHLVLSGGGMSGLVYLGALKYLRESGYDKNILHVAGASIGAFFATAFVLGITMEELTQRYKCLFNDPEFCTTAFSMTKILDSYDNLGIDNGRKLITPLQDLLGNITFLELSKKTGKNLVISATHVETLLPTYFSVDITPQVIVADALIASMTVPVLFRPVEIGNDYYVDGGVTDGIPVNAFPNINTACMIVLHINAKPVTKIKNTQLESQPKISPLTYITSLLQTYLRNYLGIRLLKTKYPIYCQFTTCPIGFAPIIWENDSLVLKISDENIDESLSIGYTFLENFMKKHHSLV